MLIRIRCFFEHIPYGTYLISWDYIASQLSWLFGKGDLFIQHWFICRPLDSTVSEDAGIEPRTVATLTLTVRRSNHSARYHPLVEATCVYCLSQIFWISSILFRHSKDLVARFQSFWFIYFYINRAVLQYLYKLLVEYHSCYPHCIRSVEGLL